MPGGRTPESDGVRMELTAGYKRTEVGVIPEDWDAVPLGSIGQFKNGINKGAEAFGHGSPFVNLMDVFGVPYKTIVRRLFAAACVP